MQHTMHRRDVPWVGGLILVLVGLVMLAAYVVPDVGLFVVLGLGIVFLAAFFYTRAYGFLVPGGILTGLGTGILLAPSLAADGMLAGAAVVGGLAVGFAIIWSIAALMHLEESHPWPLIPAAILGTVAVFMALDNPQALEYLGVVVAVAMIVGGGWLVIRQRGKSE